ncbi:O-Antigen ligase [Caulifigura coniformis]|uniref:O-Antigen ligase n=1 Tax=Caulifigura coniformis TaxID=2527983 RepID=A0A517SFQ4_9PLAN|nr:O-antigen ligase family protein [Caulifigura coniformis]QDT54952.1 O-Antigen ligase [Caulifigura coniformis]
MSGSTSSLFAALARLALIVTLVAAPWPFGGYPLQWQPPIFAGILASLVCWWVSVMTRPASHQDGGTILVDSLLPPLLLIVLAAFQLIPFANVPDVPPHAVLAQAANAEIEEIAIPAPMPISVAPAMTRVTAARLLFGLCAAFLGIQLFRDAGTRMWLYVPIALNAAAIAVFGVWQKAHWEEWQGMLFGSVPIQISAHPFGPYVNRNNGAGMLNIGAAAAAAWAFLAAAPKMGRSFRRTDDSFHATRTSTGGSEGRSNVILPVIVLVAICAGVAASLSRGALVGLGAAVIAAMLILLKSRRSRLVVSVIFVVLPLIAVAVGTFGVGKEIRKRFAVLNSYTYQDERLKHWSETMGAVQDAPWLGQGMGAYRYINRPYQQADTNRWFVNADNQFFELLVENGIVGLVLVLATIGLLLIDIRRLLESRAPWEQRDAAILGGVLVASQAAQGLADFGITLPANLLTAATLAGVTAGTAARSLPFSLVPNLGSPMVFRARTAIPIGLVLLAAGGLAWREVAVASAASVATDSIGPLDTPDAASAETLDLLVSGVQATAEMRPDDAELQRTLGNLLTFRFRTSLLAALKADPVSASRPEEELWARTSLESLFSQAATLEDEASQDQFRQALFRADETESLTAAKSAYESALAGCRWVSIAAQRNAMTQTIVDQDRNSARRSIALAAVGSPSDGSRLTLLGAMARELGADDLALAVWKQATAVSSKQLPLIMAAGGEWLAQPGRLEKVLPRDIEMLLFYAESPDGTAVARPIANHVEVLLKDAGDGTAVAGQMGRILRIRGEDAAALQQFEIAIRENPLAWVWRVRAAETKFALGRRKEAIQDLEQAVDDFPRQSAIQQKLTNLQRQAVPDSR